MTSSDPQTGERAAMADDVHDSPEGSSRHDLEAAWPVFERFVALVRAAPLQTSEPDVEHDPSPERALFLRTVVAVLTMPDDDAAPPSEFAGLDQHGKDAILPRGPIPPPATPGGSG